MDKAARIGDELLQLVRGEIPDTRDWKTEIWLGVGKRPSSDNKWRACNACEARFADLTHDVARRKEVLDFSAHFVATEPFGGTEALTPEPVYRSLSATSALLLAGIALAIGHAGYEALRGEAAAHQLWLLVPCATGPGRKVVDHHLDEIGRNVVVIGDGPVVGHLPRSVAAGPRGYVRRREKGSPPEFQFTDRSGLSMMLALAIGLPCTRRDGPHEWDFIQAMKAAFPALPVWGLSPSQAAIAREFLQDPARNLRLLVEILGWLQGHEPNLHFRFTRFVDNSSGAQLMASHDSSTECVAIDVWYAKTGKSAMTSSGSGARDGGDGQIEPMKGWEDDVAWYSQDADGGDAPQHIDKPLGVAVAWVVEVKERKIAAYDGAGKLLPGAPPVTPTPSAPTPPAAPPTPPAGKPPKSKPCRKHKWQIWRPRCP